MVGTCARRGSGNLCSPPLPPVLERELQCVGKGEVAGDGHSARPALRGRFVAQVLELQQVQRVWGQLCPLTSPHHLHLLPAKSMQLPGQRAGAGSCTQGALGSGEGRWRNKGTRTAAAAGETGFPGLLGKDALTPVLFPRAVHSDFALKVSRCSRAEWDNGFITSGCAAVLHLSCVTGGHSPGWGSGAGKRLIPFLHLFLNAT